jgi:hypothetical protein
VRDLKYFDGALRGLCLVPARIAPHPRRVVLGYSFIVDGRSYAVAVASWPLVGSRFLALKHLVLYGSGPRE